ncbi:hypothetical protein, partial [Pseudomonas sp.]|uniref:hypothetical protein n=1 Tax=Pseudomonas sp. TaxID=306 RepID=UPI002585D139
MPAYYKLSDANVDLGAHTVAEAAPAAAAAQAVVDGALNKAGLTLTATYSLNDTLAAIADPANAAVVTGAASYALTDTALTAADVAGATIAGLAAAQTAAVEAVQANTLVAGATNGAD